MTNTKTILLPFLAIACGTLVLGGCTNNKLKEENASLREQQTMTAAQVDELNKTLEMEKAARREAESKKQAAEAEAANARAMAVAAPVSQPAPQVQPAWNDSPSKRSSGGERDVVITVAGDVAFGPGQATLTAAGRKELDQVAREINRKHSGHRIRVEGYTDSDPVKRSKWGSNQALSQARADAVEKYLISKGISSGRISAVGMGSKNPKGSKAASRRVEIVIVGG